MNEVLPPRFGVVGLGLIGGSLAKAVRRARPDAWIFGVDPGPESREAARADFTCDEVAAAPDARLTRCTLVVLAAPVPQIVELLGPVAALLGPDAALTDTGGAKEVVCRAADAAGLSAFCGAHPMMGSEKSGYAAARDDLLSGGAVAVCPGARSSLAAVERVEAFWRALGNRTIRCAPEEHDRAVALISHLPYLAASALCRVAAGKWNALAEFLASSGFFSTTRVAADGTVAEAALANSALPALAEDLARELSGLSRRMAEDPEAARGALSAARAFRRALGSKSP